MATFLNFLEEKTGEANQFTEEMSSPCVGVRKVHETKEMNSSDVGVQKLEASGAVKLLVTTTVNQNKKDGFFQKNPHTGVLL